MYVVPFVAPATPPVPTLAVPVTSGITLVPCEYGWSGTPVLWWHVQFFLPVTDDNVEGGAFAPPVG